MDEGDNLNGHVGSPNPACGGFALSLHAYLPFFWRIFPFVSG